MTKSAASAIPPSSAPTSSTILYRLRDEHLQTRPDLAPLIEQTYGQWFQENLRLRFEAHGGGYGPVSVRGLEAYSEEVQKAAQDWMLTGFIIGKVRHMAAQPKGLIRGGAGIAKAIDLAAATTRYNRDRLRKAWSRYKDVAHVCGAILGFIGPHRRCYATSAGPMTKSAASAFLPSSAPTSSGNLIGIATSTFKRAPILHR